MRLPSLLHPSPGPPQIRARCAFLNLSTTTTLERLLVFVPPELDCFTVALCVCVCVPTTVELQPRCEKCSVSLKMPFLRRREEGGCLGIKTADTAKMHCLCTLFRDALREWPVFPVRSRRVLPVDHLPPLPYSGSHSACYFPCLALILPLSCS